MPIDHLPDSMKPAAYRLKHWFMTDAPMNVACAIIALVYALAYFGVFGMEKARVHPVADITGTDFWASIWLVTAALLLFTAFVDCPRGALVGLTMWSALMTLWGVQYIATWALEDWDRGPAAGTVHLVGVLVTAWAVWRGSRAEFIVRGPTDATTKHTAR